MADECKNLRLFICSWNVGESDPLDEKEFQKLLQADEDVDIYAVGLQEIKTGARQTVNSFINYDEWAKALMNYLSKRNYYLIESVRVQGISVSVFALVKHLPHVRFIETEIERTGIAGAWGNKGGVAVSTVLYGQKVCFLNVHLSAHLNNDEDRISDINEIYREMEFGGKATVESHDLILMFGDTNFRIDDLSREQIIETVAKKDYPKLWEKDQLKRHQKTHKLLSEFKEGILNFDPTYKYDPGTDIYDTSEKQRKPAWTDRILWRIHPELRARAPPFTLTETEGTFMNHMYFKQSDHKPVTAQFDLKIVAASHQEPVLTIEPEGEWATDRDGHIRIEIFEGMGWSKKDYIALYKHGLHDFRSYETYMYVGKLRRRDSTSDSSSDEEDNACQSIVADDLDDKVKHLTLKKSQITEKGIFILGYYSTKMSCLIAVSKPFEIR